MATRAATVCGLLFAALLADAQTDLPREVIWLARIRQNMERELGRATNYTCLETIAREFRSSHATEFTLRDALRLEVAYAQGRELFAWPGSDAFETKEVRQIVGGGLTGSGEFIAHARTVFLGNSAIRYFGPDDAAGARLLRYDFSVSPTFAGYTVTADGMRALAGEKGSFWVDGTSLELRRLAVHAVELPLEMAFADVLTEIEYSRVHLESSDPLLPYRARTSILKNSGEENRNRIEFTHCRQFGADSVLSVDPDARPSYDKPQLSKRAELVLPADLVCPLRLQSGVTPESKLGDMITATLDADVKKKNQIILPRGAVFTGRIRRLEYYATPSPRFVVGLEFTDITFANNHARFFAHLDTVDSRLGEHALEDYSFTVRKRTNVAEVISTQVWSSPALPGVGTFVINGSSLKLPDGMQMRWRTIDVRK